MLRELRVSNYALIEELNLSLTQGLNVLSGETGAGKSIVIGAINLLLGERATAEQVRRGADTALVEGIFTPLPGSDSPLHSLLAEAGLEVDEELIVSRELSRSGRSVGRVQGRTVPLSFLKELGRDLIDLHGQHQHQSLLRPEAHLDLLDSFGGTALAGALTRVASLYQKRQQLKGDLEALGSDSAARERRMDILSYQLQEISRAQLKPGEEEELDSREKILAHAEKLRAIVARAYSEIYGGADSSGVKAAYDILSDIRGALSEAAAIDAALAPLVALLESAAAQIEELSLELRDYQSKIDFDPAELVAIQERLNQIRALKRKYGKTVEEVLQFAAETEAELERLKNSETLARQLEEELRGVEDELTAASLELRKMRRELAAGLEKMVESALKELALPSARFSIDIRERQSFSPRGMDQVEFLFSANPGEEVKPLAKIISGGEMSRVMLALKTILASEDRIPTLIFDEVDAGIGGATIQAVAEKLALVARHHQVICVTHSPQIAAMADNHILLYKEQAGERTLTRGVMLPEEERRAELARMLDGAAIDDIGLQHVDSLLERARKFKQK
ncbi:MAG: DNA repair protein RecN [Firmicutes bacterium]|jgi:DNA repair protein RecN (Recombination protein N)|nr:DNA repair protein RecN [Bacillota bacterium]